jgi:Protein of unknown function (DUF2934)
MSTQGIVSHAGAAQPLLVSATPTDRALMRTSRPSGRSQRSSQPAATPGLNGEAGKLGPRAEISKAQIRDRAYFIYLARNGAPGNPESDWLQAEADLRAEARMSK